MTVEAMARVLLEAEDLLRGHPPAFAHPHKRLLFSRIRTGIQGRLEVSRWRGTLPSRIEVARRPAFEAREGYFQYAEGEAGTTSWHLNFADSNLFGFYGGGLLAQDEHQVLEHPVLGSLREFLLRQPDATLLPRTRENGPTPYLIKGAQRSIVFDTVAGPYGNAFSSSSTERILSSTAFPAAPTRTNVLAMVAPPGGHGRYSREELNDILLTAFVGFSACKLESAISCCVNTGHWGCGAFGGNRTLMALLQLCAAQMAGIDRLVYHVGPAAQRGSYEEALGLVDRLLGGRQVEPGQLVEEVYTLGFEWGVSDGN